MRRFISGVISLALLGQIFGLPLMHTGTKTVYAAARINYLGVTGKSYLFPAPTRGLIGHWTFDDKDMTPNVQDVSGQDNHGTLSGFTSTTSVSGRLGKALSFNGSTDKVRLANTTALNGITSSQITVSAWIYVNADSLATNKIIFSSWGGASSGYQLYMLTDGKIGAWSGSPGYTPGPAISFREWHHVAMAYDGTNVTIYVDGASQGSTPKTFTTSSLENQIGAECAGALSTSCDQYFIGYIDDVRIYNRALSAGEVRATYLHRADAILRAGVTTTPPNLQNGLVGHWTFDGPDMIPNVRDKSGQGNHGTLSGYSGSTTVSGSIGQALRFDGSDDYVNLGTAAGIQALDQLSISAWIRIANYPVLSGEAYNQYIISTQEDTGNDCGFAFMLGEYNTAASKENLYFGFAYTSTNYNGVGPGATELSLNRWYHAVVTYDRTTARLYVNGVQDAENPATEAIKDCANGLHIGKKVNTAARYWDGDIDDVRVYNRALSAAEVLQLFNLGR